MMRRQLLTLKEFAEGSSSADSGRSPNRFVAEGGR